ncbi:hypothetical protein [Dapis sp. BLCC M172]|uniref:hypothetical protein n=1 Tax=Dapis sp. BLCC M172 TaxID=2975281 RepID=UPI003CF57AEC
MNTLKYQTTIKNGQLDLPPLDLPEGTVVEAILLTFLAGSPALSRRGASYGKARAKIRIPS